MIQRADPDTCCELFAESYEISNLPEMREVERDVLGCDYGGTSWTTKAQAERIVDALDLGPAARLLDVGAGSGWPALYVAERCGCEVTLVDLPLSALTMAQRRARRDGIESRVNIVAGRGDALPFVDASFAAISHSDVLCCLPAKSAMLGECRRVAVAGSDMHFSVISVAPRLSAAGRRRAVDVGPPFVDSPQPYREMLAGSGWRPVERRDVTGEYRQSLSLLLRGLARSRALRDALGKEAVTEALRHRQDQVEAIDAGLLVREVFLATAV